MPAPVRPKSPRVPPGSIWKETSASARSSAPGAAALALLERMCDARVPPTTLSYSKAILALERGDEVDDAAQCRRLLGEISARGLRHNALTLNAVLRASFAEGACAAALVPQDPAQKELEGRSILFYWAVVGWQVGVITEANTDRRRKAQPEFTRCPHCAAL